jgi:tetratricopeptide (TPR) repeat protein
MDKDSSEIAKLTERIAKDPKSKLFVPLAEEYKKIGESVKAVAILKEGLKNNPGYVTARSFLGRLLMETGDLAGAQRELEEVIKAIPDNLLAQRKLGDLYVLQGKSDEALQCYKAALALNPGDKDLSACVADLKSGKDVSSRIARPKAASAFAATGKPAPTMAAAPKAAVTARSPSQARPAVQSPSPDPRPVATPAAPAPVTEQLQTPKPSPVTEPPSTPKPAPVTEQLQMPKSAPERAPVSSPPAQKPQAAPAPNPMPEPPAAATPVVATAQEPPAASEPQIVSDSDIVSEEGLAGMEPLQQLAAEAAALQEERRSSQKPSSTRQTAPADVPADAFDLSERAGEAFIFGDESQPMEWTPPVEPAPDLTAETKAVEPVDDINTDTLAELYISQSFYEKAIEIYERMLSERPGTRALEEKLESLRSLASAAQRTGTPVPLFADADQAVPTVSPGELHSHVASESSELPPVEAIPVRETPAPAVEAPPERLMAEAVTEGTGQVPQTDVRPVVTGEDSLRAVQEALEGTEQKRAPLTPALELGAGHTLKSAAVRRKETIDRLELWLKNVMKEKPQ